MSGGDAADHVISSYDDGKGGDERDRRMFDEYYDFPIAEYVINPTIQMVHDEFGLIGGDQQVTSTTLEGYYIKIADPKGVPGFDSNFIIRRTNFSDTHFDSDDIIHPEIDFDDPTMGVENNVMDKGYAGHQNSRRTADFYFNSLVEIYRPKKKLLHLKNLAFTMSLEKF